MPKFPVREDNIAALAREMISGLEKNPELLPNPIIDTATMNANLEFYETAYAELSILQEKVILAVEDKDRALEELVDGMKQVIGQLEETTNYDDEALQKIGWRGINWRDPNAIPGQVTGLVVPRQGKGWVQLRWNAPDDGGKVLAYRVELFNISANNWKTIDSTRDLTMTLVEQPEKKNLEFRVVAMNRTGNGEPSNSVKVVL